MNGRNYLANHVVAPQILQGTPNYNVEVSEGQTPPGEFYPAQYLPVTISENRVAGSGYVLMPGKVIGLDQNKRLVPSGLIAEIQAGRPATGAAVVDAAGLADTDFVAPGTATTYGGLSQDNGVVGIDGAFVSAADEVSAQFVDTAAFESFRFTTPVGIMRYASLMSPGSDPSNPATFTKHAYDTGGAKAFTRWAYIQVPVLEVGNRIEAITLTGANTQTGLVVGYGMPAYRMKLYGTLIPVAPIKRAGLTFTRKALPNFFSTTTTLAPGNVEFAVVGRTILFNGSGADLATLATNGTVEYVPEVKTPFTSLVVSAAAGAITPDYAMSEFIGESVTYNSDSSFVFKKDLTYATAAGHMGLGRILDMKSGSNEDLKLVRSYFRDFGLWAEQPGSATDGRNTQLSIVNAPKWIARIAVNFTQIGL